MTGVRANWPLLLTAPGGQRARVNEYDRAPAAERQNGRALDGRECMRSLIASAAFCAQVLVALSVLSAPSDGRVRVTQPHDIIARKADAIGVEVADEIARFETIAGETGIDRQSGQPCRFVFLPRGSVDEGRYLDSLNFAVLHDSLEA